MAIALFEKAAKSYQEAAEQGDTEAQLNLGLMYLSGSGVPKDKQKGLELCQKAAEQGNAKAQLVLGTIYETSQDIRKAMEWYQKAAEQGNPMARDKLLSMNKGRSSGLGPQEKSSEGR